MTIPELDNLVRVNQLKAEAGTQSEPSNYLLLSGAYWIKRTGSGTWPNMKAIWI